MAKVKITDTILRDGHQSQAATRMRTDEMLPACEKLDKVGYYSLECWGGATYDSCIRFLNEDPWERLRLLRKALPNTQLQMLLRGQNLLGYRPYSDDVVEFFVKKAVENGIDIIRCFDALNDLRNMQTAVNATKKYGGKAEIALSYTKSPVHSEDYFVKLAQDIEKMGADLICIKDMANLLLPYDAYKLVSRLKKATKLPIVIHTHNTTGTGAMVLLKAVEAGADVIDTCLSPLASGTSQPATESLVATLQGSEFDTGLDLNLLADLAGYFREVADRLTKDGFRDPGRVLAVDVKTLQYQVPGGMLSNLIGQLKAANAMDKYYDVLAEVPRVREDFGFPPLVTPTSQIVGTQAVMNVLYGERYKVVTNESKGLLRGEYGKLPGKVNEEVRRKCIGDDKVITCRFADTLPAELETLKGEMRQWYQTDEDILTYAMFPKVAPKFFEYRQAQQMKIDSTMLNAKDKTMPV
ncbi:MAG: oxaloacetate decarboxylase subunit alpha [Clostridiales bacterium]|nr:oxaloacetate decarboxylase subunit alpha [Clostridiales bacterium]